MSSGWVPRAEFESALVTIGELQSHLAALQARVTALEGSAGYISGAPQETDFEVVTGGRGDQTPTSTAAASTGADLPPHRVSVAQGIGAWIRRALRGEQRGNSGRDLVNLASRIYVGAQDSQNNQFNPPRVFNCFREVKSLCSNSSGDFGNSIFVGFPSKTEARIAVVAAGLIVPDALTRLR